MNSQSRRGSGSGREVFSHISVAKSARVQRHQACLAETPPDRVAHFTPKFGTSKAIRRRRFQHLAATSRMRERCFGQPRAAQRSHANTKRMSQDRHHASAQVHADCQPENQSRRCRPALFSMDRQIKCVRSGPGRTSTMASPRVGRRSMGWQTRTDDSALEGYRTLPTQLVLNGLL